SRSDRTAATRAFASANSPTYDPAGQSWSRTGCLSGGLTRQLEPQPLHFAYRDGGRGAVEEQKEQSKQTHAAGEQTEIDPRWGVEVPARRQKVPVERRHYDRETLEPHADQNAEGGDKKRGRAAPEPRRPEDVRREDVERRHDPVE